MLKFSCMWMSLSHRIREVFWPLVKRLQGKGRNISRLQNVYFSLDRGYREGRSIVAHLSTAAVGLRLRRRGMREARHDLVTELLFPPYSFLPVCWPIPSCLSLILWLSTTVGKCLAFLVLGIGCLYAWRAEQSWWKFGRERRRRCHDRFPVCPTGRAVLVEIWRGAGGAMIGSLVSRLPHAPAVPSTCIISGLFTARFETEKGTNNIS